MPLGELFDLERLSEECRRQGRWSFFFSSVPLKVGFFLGYDSDVDVLTDIGSWGCC